MKKHICRWFLLLISVAVPIVANAAPDATPRVVSSSLQRRGDRMEINLVFDYRNLEIGRNGQLTLTPAIVTSHERVTLSPLVLEGKVRSKVNRRQETLKGGPAFEQENAPVTVAPLRKRMRAKAPARLRYASSVPYREWMDGADLVIDRTAEVCGKSYRYGAWKLASYQAPLPARLSLIVPSDTASNHTGHFTAYIHFPLDRYELLTEFSNNASELARIDSLAAAVRDGNPSPVRIAICGYASPEGPYEYNERLSWNRAQTVRRYLSEKYPSGANLFTLTNVPEDWDSVRRWVAASHIANKDQVLNILDGTPYPDKRDAELRAIDGGRTYRMLLSEVYPPLRRADLHVGYKEPPYSPEQTEALLTTHPDRLSVYEIYQAARRYEIGSPESQKIWELALREYPEDYCVLNNAAVAALAGGNTDRAAFYLRRAGKSPAVLNNQGVAWLRQGNREQARVCFENALRAGNREAAYNLQHFPDLGNEQFPVLH